VIGVKMIPCNSSQLIQQYFVNKSKQLLAASNLAICEHAGLQGSHREALIKIYLSEIIPNRFMIDRGMIYSPYTRTHEADIVLWDANNFPKLELYGHKFFFAESVQAVLEVKTRYSSSAIKDIIQKTLDIKEMIIPYTPKITDDIQNLVYKIYAIQSGVEYSGTLKSNKEIVSIAFLINGGSRFSIHSFEKYEDLELEWPDLTILLEAGIVIVKNIEEDINYLRVYYAKEDALLLFTKYLLEILNDRIVTVEGEMFLNLYIRTVIESIQYEDYGFTKTRPGFGFVRPFFSHN
jgi:hypothetical protein